jgi:hypothetical protein
VLVFLVSSSLYAQLPTGTILGTVKDAKGNVIVGATVTVYNGEGLSRSFTTNDTGFYNFPALPVGMYSIDVSQTGFKKESVNQLLTVGQEAVLNFTLQVGNVSVTVQVASVNAVAVDTTSSSLSTLVNETTIAELPLNGRNYVNLTLLQPGITQHTQENAGQGITGTMYSSDGAPTRSNIVTLDGTLTINSGGQNASSVIGTTLGMDGIVEYKVITDLPDASFFSGMGGQTSIVSKSGGNALHGDVFEYLRNSSLDANNFFDLPPLLKNPITGVTKRIPEFQRNQFGAGLGGPIKKDKTFYFVNYEGLRQNTGDPLYVGIDNTFPAACWTPTTSYSGTIKMNGNPCAALPPAFPLGTPVSTTPVPPLPPSVSTWVGPVNPLMAPLANLFPYPNVTNPNTGLSSQYVYPSTENASEDYGQVRVDQNFSARDTSFVRFTADNARLYKPDSYPQFRDTLLSQSYFLTGAETHVFKSTLLNTARISYARTNLSTITLPSTLPMPPGAGSTGIGVYGTTSLIDNPSDTSGDCPGGNCMVGLFPAISVTTMGPSTVAPGYLNQNLITVGDDLFWTKGKHSFKMGGLLNHYDDPMWNDLIFGSVDITPSIFSLNGDYPGDTFLQGFALDQSFEQQAGSGTSTTPVADTRRDWDYWTIGAYLQDDWRTTSRLTVNLGVRYEMATVPSDTSGKNYGYSNIAKGDMNCTVTNNPSTCIAQHGPIWQNPTLKNFSPRVGFAWNPYGNGKTSVRGGYGIYYDIANLGNKLGQQSNQVPPLAMIENLYANYNGPPPFVDAWGLPPFWPFGTPSNGTVTLDVTANSCSPANSGGAGNGYNYIGNPAIPGPESYACLIPQPAGNIYNPKSTYLQQYNLSIQQQLPGNVVLSAAYVGSRGIHIRRVIDGNPVEPCNMPGSTIASFVVGPNNPCTQVPVFDPVLGPPPSGGYYLNLAAQPWNNGKNPVWDPYLTPTNSAPNSVAIPGSFPFNGGSFRINPHVPTFVEDTTDGDTYYNALQTAVAKQMAKGLQFQVAFTWSRLEDTTQGDIASLDEGSNLPSDPFNSSVDKGPTAFDAKLNLRANMVYNIPGGNFTGILGTLTKGWTFSNIVSEQTGYPFECMVQFPTNPSNSEMSDEDAGANLADDRCDIVTYSNLAAAQILDPKAVPYNKSQVMHNSTDVTQHYNQWFNPHMFTLPQANLVAPCYEFQSGPNAIAGGSGGCSVYGFLGDTPRGLMRGPGQFDWDLSVVKNTRVPWFGEKGNFEFRVEVFNILNHTNFAFPYANLYNTNYEAITKAGTGVGNTDVVPTAGQITNTLINARQIQFAARFEF